MARNPLNIGRRPNLMAGSLSLGGLGQSGGNKNPISEAQKALKKELNVIGAQAVNRAVEAGILRVEAQSRSAKPAHLFVTGKRFVTANELVKSTVIKFDHRPEMAVYALTVLAQGPGIPQVTGDYSSSFKLFVDGQEATPAAITYSKRVEIVNTAPYARMLEVGFNEQGLPFVRQVQPNIVERVMARQLQNENKGGIKARFTFVDIPNPYILQTDYHMGRGVRPGKIRKDRAKGSPINYPAVRLEL